jgi:hypothetical protein
MKHYVRSYCFATQNAVKGGARYSTITTANKVTHRATCNVPVHANNIIMLLLLLLLRTQSSKSVPSVRYNRIHAVRHYSHVRPNEWNISPILSHSFHLPQIYPSCLSRRKSEIELDRQRLSVTEIMTDSSHHCNNWNRILKT